MAKFRSKSVLIEAKQFDPSLPPIAPEVDGIKTWDNGVFENERFPNGYAMNTRAGLQEVEPGDWIIKELDGAGYYPCKDNIFKEKYALADEHYVEMDFFTRSEVAYQIGRAQGAALFLLHDNAKAGETITGVADKLWELLRFAPKKTKTD